jgi:sensor c-di-GMP phosphodiesterase-like protein
MGVYALGKYIDHQARLEQTAYVRNLADIILAQAESTLDEAALAIQEVQSKQISSCTETDIRILGFLTFTHHSIYEIGLFNAKGILSCSNLGQEGKPLDKNKEISGAGGHVTFAVSSSHVPGKNAILMNRTNADGGGIRVIVSPKALYDGFLQKDLRTYGYASIKLSNGALVNEAGELKRERVAEKGRDIVSLKRISTRYPLEVSVEILSKVLPGDLFALRIFVYLGGAVFVLLVGMIISGLSKRDTNLRSEINKAIRNNEFIPYYQPIINSKTGAIAGCEVLLRWKKTNGKLISPKLFIPYAEMNGQIIEITRNLMISIRNDMAEFQKDNSGFFYSINLTAEHFDGKEILDDVQEIFSDSVISPLDLIFEITERHPLHDMDTASMIIDGLQSLGSKGAIDDAGTGHGGLAYIQHLGVDKIKIDKMFVEAIDNNSPGAPIVDALITMSRELNISVIAEGVETASQLDYLCRHGAEYLQGFIFARPMAKDGFIQFYNAYHREIVNITPREAKEKSPALLQTIAAAAA